MNYLRQSSRERDRRNRPTVIWGTLIAIFIVIQLIFPKFFAGILFRGVAPLLSVEQRLLASRMPLGGYASTSPEGLQAQVTMLTDENIRLKELFGRVPKGGEILAGVLTLPPRSPYDTALVDAGRAEGVYANKNVYASTTLIGKVTDVYEHTSKIVLFSSPGQTYDCILGKESLHATAVGKGAGVYEIVIPREYKIAPGDPVMIPGIYSGVFGVVESVVVDPVRAFETVYFKSPINIQTLRWVTIEK